MPSSGTCTATRHGTLTAYNAHRCRCETARHLHARDEKQRRYDAAKGFRRSVPAVGTVRRLQALAWMGWPAYVLAPMAGYRSGEALLNLHRRQWVCSATARRVSDLYDALSMRPGPSETTRRRARARGWVSPLCWDDEVIDDPAASPTTARMRRERSARSARNTDEPDPVAVERALGGERVPLSKAERAEVVRRVVERGQGVARVCQLLPVSNATAQRLVNDARRETRVSSAKVAS